MAWIKLDEEGKYINTDYVTEVGVDDDGMVKVVYAGNGGYELVEGKDAKRIRRWLSRVEEDTGGRSIGGKMV